MRDTYHLFYDQISVPLCLTAICTSSICLTATWSRRTVTIVCLHWHISNNKPLYVSASTPHINWSPGCSVLDLWPDSVAITETPCGSLGGWTPQNRNTSVLPSTVQTFLSCCSPANNGWNKVCFILPARPPLPFILSCWSANGRFKVKFHLHCIVCSRKECNIDAHQPLFIVTFPRGSPSLSVQPVTYRASVSGENLPPVSAAQWSVSWNNLLISSSLTKQPSRAEGDETDFIMSDVSLKHKTTASS